MEPKYVRPEIVGPAVTLTTPAPAPIAKTPLTIRVHPPYITVPEYYIGPIPAIKREVYDMMGIKYVRVTKDGVEYYIYIPALARIIEELDLAA